MFDYEEVYSLLFAGILIVSLFLITNNIIFRYYTYESELFSDVLLLAKAVNYSGILYSSDDYFGIEIHNLGLNDSFNREFNNTQILPCLIIKDGINYPCRVVSYE